MFIINISVVITDKWIEERGKPGANSSNKTIEGNFEVIYDEALINAQNNKKKDNKTITSKYK